MHIQNKKLVDFMGFVFDIRDPTIVNANVE